MIEKIAFDHIVSKLDAQRMDINNIRNQAAISAAVTGLVASVFSSLVSPSAVENNFHGDAYLGFSMPAILLVVFFAGSIAASTRVLIDLRKFTFSFDTCGMLEAIDKADDDNCFYRSYIRDGEWFFNDNEEKINEAQSFLWWASVLGWAQIPPWMILL